ncbi:MAG: hypothetical protein KF760_33265 [Candidatus Eremiobacteraeota bacterium]|nr:hypothetical protein [Candidatus Eremiobacteraeota bacterium]MCW5869076.1 hypothetical protein [Candidatus Eremiobacteraeota bacterium]
MATPITNFNQQAAAEQVRINDFRRSVGLSTAVPADAIPVGPAWINDVNFSASKGGSDGLGDYKHTFNGAPYIKDFSSDNARALLSNSAKFLSKSGVEGSAEVAKALAQSAANPGSDEKATVLKLQSFLEKQGFSVGDAGADGKLGQDTHRALGKFLAKSGAKRADGTPFGFDRVFPQSTGNVTNFNQEAAETQQFLNNLNRLRTASQHGLNLVQADTWKGGSNLGTVEGALQGQGFTLQEIYSKGSNGKTLLEQVLTTNNLKDAKSLQPGQELILPSRELVFPDQAPPAGNPSGNITNFNQQAAADQLRINDFHRATQSEARAGLLLGAGLGLSTGLGGLLGGLFL